jgi:hypothetical protein
VARVYTTRVLYAKEAGIYVFTVPAKKRFVVRTITLVNYFAGAVSADVVVHGITIAAIGIPAQYQSANFELRAVAFEGETVRMNISHTGLNGMLTGHLFDDLAGKPPEAGPPARALLPGTKPGNWSWLS